MQYHETLSARQRDILEYIEQFVEQHNYPPAIRQIQEDLAISSTSVVAYNLKVLEQRGVLRREGKVSRGISIPKSDVITLSGLSTQVPLLGTITAGQPLPDPEDLSSDNADYVDVPADVVPSTKLTNVYALKVRGYSMIDALINDGDIVLLRYQETAEQGDMVAARIVSDNAVTLKRFYSEGERVRLQPANITMEPIYVAANDVRIQGRVVGVLRSMM
ncbi:MAG: repressor LexA [Chloroflexia bacterium]|nr:repressor LexA [Chloroflexia bacterium]